MQSSEDARLIETGDVVVQKVETFKKQNGRLPNSRAEMGLPDSETSQPFHEKRGEENYVVYFNRGLIIPRHIILTRKNGKTCIGNPAELSSLRALAALV